MFDNKTVIYLTRKKIWSSNFAALKPQLIEREWDGFDPTLVFKEVKDSLKPQGVKIVLGDDLSFVTLFEIADKIVTREMVLEVTRSLLPIELSDSNFDWKIVGTNPKNLLYQIQIFAITGEVLNAVSYAAKVDKLKIESINPVSLLLAAEFREMPEPQLISWSRQEQIAVVTYKGNVYVSETILKDSDEKLKSLTKFAKDKFNLIVTPRTERSFDPLTAIIHQKIFRGQDKDTLEIKILPNPTSPVAMKETTSKKEEVNAFKSSAQPTANYNVRKIIVLTGILILALGVVLFRHNLRKVRNIDVVSLPTTVPTLVPSAVTHQTENPENLGNVSEYSIQVLNGSGVAGEATRVVDILKAEGFTTLEIDNADSYIYTNTQVQMKKSVPKGIFTIVERALNSEYSVEKTEALTTDAKYDLIIVVGERRTQP